MHLRQPEGTANIAGFTYSACRPFTKNKERIQTFKETGDLRYISQNEDDGYQRGLASMVYTLFGKKSSGGAVTRAHSETSDTQDMQDKSAMPNQELAEELHKSVTRKFEKRKVYSSFIDNI